MLVKMFAKPWTVCFQKEYLIIWQTNENMQARFKLWEQHIGVVFAPDVNCCMNIVTCVLGRVVHFYYSRE